MVRAIFIAAITRGLRGRELRVPLQRRSPGGDDDDDGRRRAMLGRRWGVLILFEISEKVRRLPRLHFLVRLHTNIGR